VNLVLISLVAWRLAALAVWLVIAIGAFEIVSHVLRRPRHRARLLK
jgi:hypothetical protein